MSVFIDREFLLRVSTKLPLFKQKKEDLYNFRCPICGDSQKHKLKSRGYVFRKKNDYFFMCHNCGLSTSFYNFLDKVDPILCKEYALERFKSNQVANTLPKIVEINTEFTKPIFYQKIDLESIAQLPEDHFAKAYVISRQIPLDFHSRLYFTPDFKKFVESLGIEKDLNENEQRLVIPFYDENKNLIALQGRALGESKMRYITIKMNDDNHKFYGLDRIDKDKVVYVMEGPIDSMFIDNAVATADSNLMAASRVIDKSKLTLIFDNEPRNKEICKIMDKAIDEHYNVVIWPQYMCEKDINEMILADFTTEELQDIIDNNTFVNLRAKAEFVNWKKI